MGIKIDSAKPLSTYSNSAHPIADLHLLLERLKLNPLTTLGFYWVPQAVSLKYL